MVEVRKTPKTWSIFANDTCFEVDGYDYEILSGGFGEDFDLIDVLLGLDLAHTVTIVGAYIDTEDFLSLDKLAARQRRIHKLVLKDVTLYQTDKISKAVDFCYVPKRSTYADVGPRCSICDGSHYDTDHEEYEDSESEDGLLEDMDCFFGPETDPDPYFIGETIVELELDVRLSSPGNPLGEMFRGLGHLYDLQKISMPWLWHEPYLHILQETLLGLPNLKELDFSQDYPYYGSGTLSGFHVLTVFFGRIRLPKHHLDASSLMTLAAAGNAALFMEEIPVDVIVAAVRAASAGRTVHFYGTFRGRPFGPEQFQHLLGATKTYLNTYQSPFNPPKGSKEIYEMISENFGVPRDLLAFCVLSYKGVPA